MKKKIIYNVPEVKMSYKNNVKKKDRIKVKDSSSVNDVLKSVWSDKMEYIEEFVILCLNRANEVLGWVKISQGGTSATILDAKLIFQVAIKTNSSSIIISHNHPSGNLKHSEADIKITRKIKDGCALLDLDLLDHIIITDEGYFSFAEEGVL